MKPNYDIEEYAKLGRNWAWPAIEQKLGRPITELDKIMCTCAWAGQLGHEKCGYCMACKMPRQVPNKSCSHPPKDAWRPT